MEETKHPRQKRRFTWRRLLTFFGGLTLLLLLAVVATGLWARAQILASLPQLDGEVDLPCLSAAATIERDAAGVPRLRASSRDDLACVTGFVHGQDRFFQMDLLRREPAGELSALFGRMALGADRSVRKHRFRARLKERFETLEPDHRRLLQAYAAGVNAGLQGLQAAPPEYLVLRTSPEPWRAEDSLLVTAAMYRSLQGDDGGREVERGRFVDALPPELFAFLVPDGTRWDAPLIGPAVVPPAIPGPEVIDLRRSRLAEPEIGVAGSGGQPTSINGVDPPQLIAEAATPEQRRRGWAGLAGFVPQQPDDDAVLELDGLIGSNNWAVDATASSDGHAWMANDMHLPLSVPNIWYRAELHWDDEGQERRLAGVTLPGTPTLVAGSNGHVAWGFTNSQGDWKDVVIVEADPNDSSRYRVPEGWDTIESYDEVIEIRGEASVTETVRWTRWGPLVGRDAADRPLALRWVAHDDAGLNVGLAEMERVESLDGALDLAPRCGIPHQNLVVADADGRIGWTLAGAIPARRGSDGRTPRSWADGGVGWDDYVAAEEYPRIVDPAEGRLWTANQRTTGGEAYALLGADGYALGARAQQIRDGLLAKPKISREDLLAIHLDDRAVFLERWRALLLETLTEEWIATDPQLQRLRRLVDAGWTGRASVDSAGFRMVRAFRIYAMRAVAAPFERLVGADASYGWITNQEEAPSWTLLTEQPPHLLDPAYDDWQSLLRGAVDEIVRNVLLDDAGQPRQDAAVTWGALNRSRIEHPLSGALPSWLPIDLDMPSQPLPGASHMPRVQSAGFGASERFAISPGREEQSYLHLPGGPSGHFASPYFRAGHEAWATGEPTPLLAGPAQHRLEARPAGPAAAPSR